MGPCTPLPPFFSALPILSDPLTHTPSGVKGSLYIPTPRNALESVLPEFADGKSPTQGCTCTNGNPGGDYETGCDQGLRGPSAQSCLWWSQGTEDHAAPPPIPCLHRVLLFGCEDAGLFAFERLGGLGGTRCLQNMCVPRTGRSPAGKATSRARALLFVRPPKMPIYPSYGPIRPAGGP